MIDYTINPPKWPNEPPKIPFLAKKKTRYLIILAIFLFITVGLVVRNHTLAQWPQEGSAYDEKTLKPREAGLVATIKNFLFHNNNILNGQNEDRVNILILGIGGAGHDGPYLTDTNILLNIKPSTKEVAMVSIPRDLGVQIPGYGVRKINNANALGEVKETGYGGEFARQIFADTFKIKLPYYIRVDFKAFTEIIDTVGGITIDVPRSFTDTQYPAANNGFQTIFFTKGVQTMNGEQALMFARSRHGNNGEGNDYARGLRQQLVLSALKEKILTLGTYTNPLVIQKMLAALSSHIVTNLDFGQIMYLASLAKETNGQPKNMVLDDSLNGYLVSGTGEDGAWLLFPKTGNYDEINKEIENIFQIKNVTDTTIINVASSGEATIKNSVTSGATIEIQNGTWRAGLGARIKKQLEDKGFRITAVGNSAKRPEDKTLIYLNNPEIAAETAKKLSNELSAPMVTIIPDWIKSVVSAANETASNTVASDIIIILGNDTKE